MRNISFIIIGIMACVIQCGAPILILNEALSYEGNDQQELQAFLDEHAECKYFF